MDYEEIKSVIEGLLLVCGDEGIEARTMAELFDLNVDQVVDLVHDMQADYKRNRRGIQIIEVAGAFQFVTLPEHATYFEKLAFSPSHSTLSQAALETMAIIAYKQPITRAEIEDIRGVKCEKAINTLLTKKLIIEKGRSETTGRPILYGTTKEFLEYFGLNHLKDLPPVPHLHGQEDVEQEAELLFQKLKEQSE